MEKIKIIRKTSQVVLNLELYESKEKMQGKASTKAYGATIAVPVHLTQLIGLPSPHRCHITFSQLKQISQSVQDTFLFHILSHIKSFYVCDMFAISK